MSQALSQLPVGALVVDFNTKYNDEPIIWQVLEHDHDGEGTTTLCSRDIISLKCFDAKEPNNSDSNRQSYGNNRYLYSNLLQWLNSDQDSWYTAQHNADTAPNSSNIYQENSVAINPYDTEAGFLTNFSNDLKGSLQTVSKKTVLNAVTDGGGSEDVSSKVFLLSTTEIGLANENSIAEGSIYAYYSQDNQNSRRVKKVANAAACGNYTGTSAGSAWSWWLRTPNSDYSHYARRVSSDGSLNYDRAYYGYNGVAPALVIPSSTKVGDEPAADGVYALSPGWNVKKVYIGDENGESKQIEPTPIKIVSWQNGTDEEIGAMIDAYYNNELSLEKIKSVWAVGDARTISLSAMSATGVGESHRAQEVELQIIDFDHDILTTAQGGKTKALITVDLKNCLRDANVSDIGGSSNTEHGYINSSNTNVGGWTSCARRTWCNDVYYNALPTYLKNRIKPVNKLTSVGNQSSTINTDSDKCFLLSEIEIFGSITRSKAGEGSQYTYYTTASNRYKLPKWNSSSVSDLWWERSPYGSNATYFCFVSYSGLASYSYASIALGLSPACCL